MAENKEYLIKDGVTITDEVIATIAGVAALDVDGVDTLLGGLDRDAVTKAGAGKIAKCVGLTINSDREAKLVISINIKYGYGIPVVCKAVQNKVQETLESTIGIKVTGVDVRIASVSI